MIIFWILENQISIFWGTAYGFNIFLVLSSWDTVFNNWYLNCFYENTNLQTLPKAVPESMFLAYWL